MYQQAERWVEAYIHAWTTNDPEDIGRLWAEDALYYPGPFDEPWRGREGIVKAWLERRDEPDTWSFRYQVLATAEDLVVVRGWTTYRGPPPREYSNIWVIRFDNQARATEFTEWWMKRKGQ